MAELIARDQLGNYSVCFLIWFISALSDWEDIVWRIVLADVN
jgi:hypothetical protein